MPVERLSEFDHPSWFTALSTGVAYGILLLVMFTLLFLLPYVIFSLL